MMTTDPVRAMSIERAKRVGRVEHTRKSCPSYSAHCLSRFKSNAERYLAPPAATVVPNLAAAGGTAAAITHTASPCRRRPAKSGRTTGSATALSSLSVIIHSALLECVRFFNS